MSAYAPYNNAMRLGQGFNSYTQTPCIDHAVLFDPPPKSHPVPTTPPTGVGQRQIVTYSAQWVEKLSDIVEATNLSPSTSIKSGSIGNSGKGGGGFIDCDKFKESDLNMLIYVRVINQQPPADSGGGPGARFQRIKNLPSDQFHAVFGDCYISGFLEGGEFTSLISIKTGSEDVKTLAKVALTSLSGNKASDGAILAARKALIEGAEVTVNVSWSGGGQLKDEDTQWDIDTILRVAARFPELVYKCPQRIAAVLSKYTGIRSFLEAMPGVIPLDYENVVLYTGDLLDAYMEYKHIVKKLNHMLEAPGLYKEADDIDDDTREELKPIRLVLSELDDAKTYCRNQMLRIVKEVDNISQNPGLATDEDHIPPYMSSELFGAMIPKPAAPAPPETLEPLHAAPLASYTPAEQALLLRLAPLARHFVVSPRAGSLASPPPIIPLSKLPTDCWPVQVELYSSGRLPRAFAVHYAHLDPVVSLGKIPGGGAPVVVRLQEGEKVVHVTVVSASCWREGVRLVTWMKVATNCGLEVEVGDEAYDRRKVERVEMVAPEGAGLKAFWGGVGDAVDSVGVVWGRG